MAAPDEKYMLYVASPRFTVAAYVSRATETDWKGEVHINSLKFELPQQASGPTLAQVACEKYIKELGSALKFWSEQIEN